MSEDRVSFQQAQGELAATRSLLRAALECLNAAALEYLLDLETRNLADLDSLWSHPRSDFQVGLMNELKRLQFRLRERGKFPEGDEAASQEFYFVCIECSTIMDPDFSPSTVCPTCGTAKWLELVRHVTPPFTLN